MKLGDDQVEGSPAHPRAVAIADSRVDAVVTQVFAPHALRLSEADGAALFGMLARLVADVEVDLRRLLPLGAGHSALTPSGDTLARLSGAAFFGDRELAAALLDRIDEAALSARLACGAQLRVVAGDSHPALRAQYAERSARRWDADGMPVLPLADMPEPVLRRTIARIAAAVCLGAALPVGDAAVERACAVIFARQVAAGSTAAAADALARATSGERPGTIPRALASGDLLLASACGGLSIGIAPDVVLRALIRPDCGELATILRVLDLNREVAARTIFAAVASAPAYTAAAAARMTALIAEFDALDVEAARRRLHAPSDRENYWSARVALDTGRRERAAFG